MTSSTKTALPTAALALALAATASAQLPGALGVQGTLIELTDRHAVVLRSETAADLNGDGDTDDSVPWILDRSTGHSVTVPFAIRSVRPSTDRYLVFRVDEALHGADLTGDGVLDDDVPLLVDLRTGTPHVIPFPTLVGVARLNETHAIFLVTEDAADLNGDGDTDDHVAHLYELRTGQTQNLGLACISPAYTIPGADTFAVLVSESAQGGTDLSSDGVANFDILHLVDRSGGVTNTGLALFGQAVVGNTLVLAAHEALTGVDLDGDGQTSQSILSLLDMQTGVLQLTDEKGLGVNVDDEPPVEFGGYIFVRVNFGQHRRIDPTTLAVEPFQEPVPVGARFLLGGVDESGADLNGDGDAGDDNVAHLFDVDTLTPVENIGIVSSFLQEGDPSASDGRVLALNLSEAAHGNRDRNFDGDSSDALLVTHDLLTGRQREIRLAISFVQVSDGLVVFLVEEAGEGDTDLNGDGDTDDDVLFVHDTRHGTVESLGVDAGVVLTAGRSVGFTVVESAENEDLNGDGDLDDAFPHVVTF